MKKWIGLVMVCLANFQVFADIPKKEPLKLAQYPSGMAVSSAHLLATEAGLTILGQGGNAFDAAIAVAATLAVVAPYHSGLGGGGFWLMYDAKNKKNSFIDSRETAPSKASRDMYLDSKGKPIPGLSINGPLAAAIPGEPAAIAYVAKHYGKLPLSKSLAPAIALAEKGFKVDHQFVYFTTMGDRLAQLKRFPSTASVFLNQGRPYKIGERLVQPDLANTLKQLAKQGHDGFYKGPVAKQLVKSVQDLGGIWTEEDLANYQVKIRDPLVSAYRNMLIITAPPPSAGGVGLITMLNILQGYSLPEMNKVQWIHYLTEAMRLAFWQRDTYLADPDFHKIPLSFLLSADNAKQLRQLIKPDRATASDTLPKMGQEAKAGNTTHISILDKEGNRVAATLTVNYIFGSSVIAQGTGVLLNDEMDDFSIKPGVHNVFGLVGSVANAIDPGKRPLSSMAPTFLLMPGRVAICGTPGGSRIPSMMLLAALTFYEGKGAITMVSKMRFHHQYLPDFLQFEPETLTKSEQDELRGMGYALMSLNQYYGDMQAITWDQTKNFITAASDPRHIGQGAVVAVNDDNYGFSH
jgi:gamma-glutamyltranspeptidase/glutathione hydrolase